MKTTFWAYFFWAFGGIFGTHHVYLERDNQAFIWFSTLGFFGIGYIRDFFRIPEYVSEANNDLKFQNVFQLKIRQSSRPLISLQRNAAAFILSCFWASMVCLALPEKKAYGIDFTICKYCIPTVIALATWMVGNTGLQRGTIKHCFYAAQITGVMLYLFMDDVIWICGMSLASVLTFDGCSKTWRRNPNHKRHYLRRILFFTALISIYCSIWFCYIYFVYSWEINNDDGEITFSKLFGDFLVLLKQLFISIWTKGPIQTWNEVSESFDETGTLKAYRVLGLPPTASQHEITHQYRRLLLEHHPDKLISADIDSVTAQENFFDIQDAYELLSTAKIKRLQRQR